MRTLRRTRDTGGLSHSFQHSNTGSQSFVSATINKIVTDRRSQLQLVSLYTSNDR